MIFVLVITIYFWLGIMSLILPHLHPYRDPSAELVKRTATLSGLEGDIQTGWFLDSTQVSVNSVNLAITFLTFIFYLCVRRWKPATHVVLPWYTFGSLIVVYGVTSILATATASTQLQNETYFMSSTIKYSTTVCFLRVVSEVVLLAIFNLQVLRHIFNQKQRNERLPTIANGIGLALVIVLAIPTLIFFAYLAARWDFDDSSNNAPELYNLPGRQTSLAAAYYFLYVAAAFLASVLILSAVLSPSNPKFNRKVKFWSIVACASICAMSIAEFVEVAILLPTNRKYVDDKEYTAMLVFQRLPSALAVMGVLMMTYHSFEMVVGKDEEVGQHQHEQQRQMTTINMQNSKVENGEIAELGPALCHEMPESTLCHELPGSKLRHEMPA